MLATLIAGCAAPRTMSDNLVTQRALAQFRRSYASSEVLDAEIGIQMLDAPAQQSPRARSTEEQLRDPALTAWVAALDEALRRAARFPQPVPLPVLNVQRHFTLVADRNGMPIEYVSPEQEREYRAWVRYAERANDLSVKIAPIEKVQNLGLDRIRLRMKVLRLGPQDVDRIVAMALPGGRGSDQSRQRVARVIASYLKHPREMQIGNRLGDFSGRL